MRIKPNRKQVFWLVVILCLVIGAGQAYSTATSTAPGDLVISEFLAANATGLTDEDGDLSDWIEIYNRSNQAVNLSGWSLTDDPTQPEKWTFPDVVLGSHQYRLVFASGKDRKPTEPEAELHANFNLQKTGEFLGLYNILKHRFMDEVSPQFPAQFPDIAYGRYGSVGSLMGDDPAFGYLPASTPGGENDTTVVWKGMVPQIRFSAERGFYDAPFGLELSTTIPGATIRYTTDGSEPTETNGRTYIGPVVINTTTLLRARAFKPKFMPSSPETHTYIFLDDVLTQPANPAGFPETWGIHREDFRGYVEVGSPVAADYAMDARVVDDPRYGPGLKDDLKSIPTVSIVTDRQSFEDLYSNPQERGEAWERPASVEFFDPGSDKPGFQIEAGLRIQGGWGRLEYMPKHSFRLFFKREYGAAKLEYPLFPDSSVDKFDTLVLRAGVRSLCRSAGQRPHPDNLHPGRVAAGYSNCRVRGGVPRPLCPSLPQWFVLGTLQYC